MDEKNKKRSEYHKQYYQRRKSEPDFVQNRTDRARVSYQTDPNRKLSAKTAMKKYQQTDRGKIAYRRANLKHKYGISLEYVEVMLENQGRKCANTGCNLAFDDKNKPHIDHDHISGKVRGILCNWCNIALGLCRDDRNVLLGLANYLEKS